MGKQMSLRDRGKNIGDKAIIVQKNGCPLAFQLFEVHVSFTAHFTHTKSISYTFGAQMSVALKFSILFFRQADWEEEDEEEMWETHD